MKVNIKPATRKCGRCGGTGMANRYAPCRYCTHGQRPASK